MKLKREEGETETNNGVSTEFETNNDTYHWNLYACKHFILGWFTAMVLHVFIEFTVFIFKTKILIVITTNYKKLEFHRQYFKILQEY